MVTLGLVFGVLAALQHLYVWWLETVGFRDRGRHVLDVPDEDADAVAPWVFFLGCSHLFLAVGTLAGAAWWFFGRNGGPPMVFFGLACMLAGAIVVGFSQRGRWRRQGLTQGVLPLLGLLAMWLPTLMD